METISRHAGSVALLVGLLVGFFVLMSYQVNRAETVSTVESTVQTVISPAHRLVSAVWLGISDGWSGYVGLVGSAREAAALQERVGVLERRNASLEEAARENARLRQLLGLPARLETTSIAAETIGRDAAFGYRSLIINRGSRDGVRADAPVLSPSGVLVGRVADVSLWTSSVQLITDPQSAVGAKVVRSGAPGVVHGAGSPALELAYVSSLDDVDEGDLVVTAGDDSIYPAGIEIGRVVKVEQGAPVPDSPRMRLARNEAALFLDVQLESLVEIRRVDQVLLLLPAHDSE